MPSSQPCSVSLPPRWPTGSAQTSTLPGWPPQVDREVLWMLADYKLHARNAQVEDYGRVQDFGTRGRHGNVFTLNGTAAGALYASNSDIEFYEGHGGPYFNMTFVPRIWNGTIYYAPWGQAGYGLFGEGCAGGSEK